MLRTCRIFSLSANLSISALGSVPDANIIIIGMVGVEFPKISESKGALNSIKTYPSVSLTNSAIANKSLSERSSLTITSHANESEGYPAYK